MLMIFPNMLMRDEAMAASTPIAMRAPQVDAQVLFIANRLKSLRRAMIACPLYREKIVQASSASDTARPYGAPRCASSAPMRRARLFSANASEVSSDC